MSVTTPPAVSALPDAPSRADPANFATRADTFLGALQTWASQLVALATNVYNNAVETFTNATSASSSASSATASATAAANSANASATATAAAVWVSGTTYAYGVCVWSPMTCLVYRRKVAGAGTTDPSQDATNWALAGYGTLQIVVDTTSASITVQTWQLTIVRRSDVLVAWNLPASPNVGDEAAVLFDNGRYDNEIRRNGQLLSSRAETMYEYRPGKVRWFRFIGGTVGWQQLM